MASRLTTTADATKKGAIFLGIGIIAFFVLRFTLTAAYNACCVRPTPTPTPYINPAYGVLEAPLLVDGTTTSAGKKFVLETIDGNIPEGTSSAMVYEVEKKSAELDYQQQSLSLAENLGFRGARPVKNTDRTFLFTDQNDPNRKIEIDFIYYNMNYSYDNLAAYVSLERSITPTIERAKQDALNFVSNARPDLRNTRGILELETPAKGNFVYFDPTTQITTPVASQLQANLTKVNIPRMPIYDIPFISPYINKSLINFTFTGVTTSANSRDFQNRMLSAEIVYWPINNSPNVLGVYPTRSTQRAWELLNQGKAIVLSPSNPGDEYNIRKIYLAYYEPPTYQPYIQPVWVFEGDKPTDSNFLFRAFVPAVQEGYVKE